MGRTENKTAGFYFDKKKNLLKYSFTYEGKRYSTYGKTQKECREKETEKRLLLKEHKHLDNQRITLNNYYDSWLEEHKNDVSECTIYTNGKMWVHVKKYLGTKRVVSISTEEVKEMRRKMQANGKSAETINRAVKLLKQVLNQAKKENIISYNPCDPLKSLKSERPTAQETNHRALNDEELKLFFSHASGEHFYNLYRFMLHSGVRASEALSLTWFDCNFETKEISINKTITRISNKEWVIGKPKTKNSKRVIPMTPELRNILEKQKEQNIMLSANNSLVFPNTAGNRATYVVVDNHIKKVLNSINGSEEAEETEEAKETIERFSSHAFRSTFATRCVEQGMMPATLQKLMGHSKISTTMEYYVNVSFDTKEAELEKVVFAIV